MPEDSNRFELRIALGDASFEATGSATQVMAALKQFRELAEPPTGDAPPTVTTRKTPSGAATKSGTVLPVFLQSLGLTKNPEVATAIVAWSEMHDNKPSLTAPAIRKLWLGTPIKKPGNVNRDAETAVKAGLLSREGNAYSVTGFGKQQLKLP